MRAVIMKRPERGAWSLLWGLLFLMIGGCAPGEDEEGALNICLPGTPGCLASLNCRESEGRLLCEPGLSERDHTIPLPSDRGDAAPPDRALDQRASEDQTLDADLQGADEGLDPEPDAALSLDEGLNPAQDEGLAADAGRAPLLDADPASARDGGPMADEGAPLEDQRLRADSALDAARPAADAETD